LLKHRKRTLVPVKYVSFSNLKQMSEAGQLIAESVDQKPADLAEQILDFPMKKRFEIAKALNPKQLALVLEEMPEEEQSKILAQFDQEMQADIVQEIQPDDAADLLATLPQQEREDILQKMTPEEAEDVRQLLEYSADSAGGLMTTLPVILSSETDVASALARIRDPDLPPALASVVFVCRPPLETPTGIFQGTAHFQNMLRVPPTTKLGTIIDQALPSLPPDASIDQVMRELATYDTLALPIVSARKQLLGVVSIDDVLDHILPANWREVD
jgi:Mg/Co/Ni transporter MgtE